MSNSEVVGTLAGQPIAFGSLGAHFMLERLVPEDRERLAIVNEIVWEWLGGFLRNTWSSWRGNVCDVRRCDLDYISTYSEDLAVPLLPGANDSVQRMMANMYNRSRTDFFVGCNGGRTASSCSPFGYQFWAETPEVDASGCLHPYAVLSVAVPDTWPLEDFAAKVEQIAGALRIRWATAGFTYSTWGVSSPLEAGRFVANHAKRFPGFDVGYFHESMETWHEWLRTVSWQTYLGPAFVARAASRGVQLGSDGEIEVRPVGEGLLIQAGQRPERGDANRLRYPRSYVVADALLRPIRLGDAAGAFFGSPWSEAVVRRWLRRFELRVN